MIDRYEKIIPALLLKIKESNDGEAENARKTLKKLCDKYNLDFDELISGRKELVERIYDATAANQQIVVQIIMRYGNTLELFTSKRKNNHNIMVSLDDATHLEVSNAMDVLLPLYRKEMRKIKEVGITAFAHKHGLFFQGERPERIGQEKKKTFDEELEHKRKMMLAGTMADGMEDAAILKRLK